MPVSAQPLRPAVRTDRTRPRAAAVRLSSPLAGTQCRHGMRVIEPGDPTVPLRAVVTMQRSRMRRGLIGAGRLLAAVGYAAVWSLALAFEVTLIFGVTVAVPALLVMVALAGGR